MINLHSSLSILRPCSKEVSFSFDQLVAFFSVLKQCTLNSRVLNIFVYFYSNVMMVRNKYLQPIKLHPEMCGYGTEVEFRV